MLSRASLVVVLVASTAPHAAADSTGSVGVGGGFLIGGDSSDGLGMRGEGAAGVLAGIRAHFVPLSSKLRITPGPDAILARWTTDVGERDGTLAMIGVRVVRGTEQAGIHLAARVGMWAPGDRAVLNVGFGGHTRLARKSRFSIGWEIGAARWKQEPVPIVPGEIAATYKVAAAQGEGIVNCQQCDDLDGPDGPSGGFPFLAVNGWLEIIVEL